VQRLGLTVAAAAAAVVSGKLGNTPGAIVRIHSAFVIYSLLFCMQ